jgi:hypothetical protein
MQVKKISEIRGIRGVFFAEADDLSGDACPVDFNKNGKCVVSCRIS